MIFVKLNGKEYTAEINGKMVDYNWDNRESKEITIAMPHDEAVKVFHNDAKWSIIDKTDNEGTLVETEWDNSDFCVAGDIIDHRDGTVTVKMGKMTDLEQAYYMILGGGSDE